jgi:hypothetical protein
MFAKEQEFYLWPDVGVANNYVRRSGPDITAPAFFLRYARSEGVRITN